MRPFLKATSVPVAAALLLSGCFGHDGRLLGAIFATAVVTAAIVSSQPPPPPRYARAPPPRAGYTWEPGYWTWRGTSGCGSTGTGFPTIRGMRGSPRTGARTPPATGGSSQGTGPRSVRRLPFRLRRGCPLLP
ncbi:MAG: YXWGXW repeat-containing protein, partial [Deltaproteobacteria bacterium]|nr:YXWGXW repeat-containing protein [Deltaproteobacteria bacterium]